MWLHLGEYRGPRRLHAFVCYMVEKSRRKNVRDVYEAYVTDSLRNIPKGAYLDRRYVDLITPHEDIDEQEIVRHVKELVGGDGE